MAKQTEIIDARALAQRIANGEVSLEDVQQHIEKIADALPSFQALGVDVSTSSKVFAGMKEAISNLINIRKLAEGHKE